VSDPHRTIIDMLDDPSVGGGIRHVLDCLKTYLETKEAETSKLIEYADRLGNGAVFKRLGFLLWQIGGYGDLAETCRTRLTAGNAKLDPAIPCPRLIKKWRLWIPETWGKKTPKHD
jgi:predicted transcriptional regulator of viral defense system